MVSRGSSSRSELLNLWQPCASTHHSHGSLGMMRRPVRSRFESSKAPRPHRSELPGAENSGSEKNHHQQWRRHSYVEVATDEVTIVLSHVRA